MEPIDLTNDTMRFNDLSEGNKRLYINYLNLYTTGGVTGGLGIYDGWILGGFPANNALGTIPAYRRFHFYISLEGYHMVKYERDFNGGVIGGNGSPAKATFAELWHHRDLTPYKYAFINRLRTNSVSLSRIDRVRGIVGNLGYQRKRSKSRGLKSRDSQKRFRSRKKEKYK